MSFKAVIQQAQQACESHDVHPELARRLMLELCNEEGIDLYTMIDESVPESLNQRYLQGVERLCKQEPLAYVLGYEWFYGYKINVNQDVLIPREETEELVSHVLVDIDELYKNPTVVDIATGSGAIAIALKKEVMATVYATDISDEALIVAQKNATENETSITFLQGDMGEPLLNQSLKFDVIVCNPPYILQTEEVADSVLNYEPHLALFGGEDGLKFYRKVLEESLTLLNPKGMIAFEMGYQQKESLTKLIRVFYPEASVICRQDLNGLDRMMFIYI